jgi:predicted porin
VQVFFGENASNATVNTPPVDNSDSGNGYSAFVAYAKGPIYVSLAQQQTKGVASPTVPATAQTVFGDYTQRGLAASYDFGMAKAVYTYATEDLITSATTTATNKSHLLGVVVPFGAANVKASYVRSVENTGAGVENVGTLFGLGADYALSKRTVVYGTLSRVTNDNSAATSTTVAAVAGNAAYSAGNSGLSTAANPTSTGLAFGIKHSF